MNLKKYLIIISLSLMSQWCLSIDIEIRGNHKTSDEVIKIELKDLLEKEDFSDLKINEIEKRLWNLRLFSDVKVSHLKKKKLIIAVSERWTLIPIAKLSGGGGTKYYALGAYDINSFGKNIELGAQYESLNNRPAGVMWFRNPHFLGNRKLNIGSDIWTINRGRVFYDSNNNENGAYTLERKMLNSFIEYKWSNDFFKVGAQFQYQENQISDFGVSQNNKEKNKVNMFTAKDQNTTRWIGTYLYIGNLNFKNFLVGGNQLKFKADFILQNRKEHHFKSEIQYSFFKILNNDQNFAWQFKIEQTTLDSIEHQYYLGGLSEVRGYMDGQFYNSAYWQNNLEYRFIAYEKSWGVIQSVIFSDQAKEESQLHKIINSKQEILLSSGIGVRFISPKIYRFVARVDFAQSHTRINNKGISFGIQQFF